MSRYQQSMAEYEEEGRIMPTEHVDLSILGAQEKQKLEQQRADQIATCDLCQRLQQDGALMHTLDCVKTLCEENAVQKSIKRCPFCGMYYLYRESEECHCDMEPMRYTQQVYFPLYDPRCVAEAYVRILHHQFPAVTFRGIHTNPHNPMHIHITMCAVPQHTAAVRAFMHRRAWYLGDFLTDDYTLNIQKEEHPVSGTSTTPELTTLHLLLECTR